jgi:hypothetical protein
MKNILCVNGSVGMSSEAITLNHLYCDCQTLRLAAIPWCDIIQYAVYHSTKLKCSNRHPFICNLYPSGRSASVISDCMASDIELPSSVGEISDANDDCELPSSCGSGHESGSDVAPGAPSAPAGLDVSMPSNYSDADCASSDDDSVCDLPDPVSESEIVDMPDLRGDGPRAAASAPRHPETFTRVPRPDQVVLSQRPVRLQMAAELYSVPRVLPVVMQYLGLDGQILSLDIHTGWDFRQSASQSLSLQILQTWNVLVVILSPPCTAFSVLQELWNFPRLSAEKVKHIWSIGMTFLIHAMNAAQLQLNSGRYFIFEHPAGATSWKQPCVQKISMQPGVFVIQFDQCMLGLVTKVDQIPTRKRTKIMTNIPALVKLLSVYKCDRSHDHCRIEGTEGGVKRSVWAQCYPEALCNVLAKSVASVVRG